MRRTLGGSILSCGGFVKSTKQALRRTAGRCSCQTASRRFSAPPMRGRGSCATFCPPPRESFCLSVHWLHRLVLRGERCSAVVSVQGATQAWVSRREAEGAVTCIPTLDWARPKCQPPPFLSPKIDAALERRCGCARAVSSGSRESARLALPFLPSGHHIWSELPRQRPSRHRAPCCWHIAMVKQPRRQLFCLYPFWTPGRSISTSFPCVPQGQT